MYLIMDPKTLGQNDGATEACKNPKIEDGNECTKYYKKTLGIVTTCMCIPSTIVLLVFQVVMTRRLVAKYSWTESQLRGNDYDFTTSGLGYVASLISGISLVVTTWTSCRPSLATVFLTCLTQAASITTHITLATLLILNPLANPRRLGAWGKTCCVDETSQGYQCRFLTCADAQRIEQENGLEFRMLVIMVAMAIIQSSISLVPYFMSARTFCKATVHPNSWRIVGSWKAFLRRSAGHTRQYACAVHTTKQDNGLVHLEAIRMAAHTQLGFGLLSIVITMSVGNVNTVIWELVQLVAILSYVLVMWMSTTSRPLTNFIVVGVAGLHFVGASTMLIALIVAASHLRRQIDGVALPLLAIEMLLCLVLAALSSLPAFKEKSELLLGDDNSEESSANVDEKPASGESERKH